MVSRAILTTTEALQPAGFGARSPSLPRERAAPSLLRRRKASPAHLVRRAREGDRAAFERLWARHAPTAHGILLSMVPAHDADDLMQDVALAAWNALGSLDKAHSFPSWLCAIARNLGRDALKRRRRVQPVSLSDCVEGEEARTAPPSSLLAEADEVLAEIRALPECYREPLIMRLVLGMSGPEIAAHVGLTKGSVRVNLHRGMKLLRQRLDGEGERS